MKLHLFLACSLVSFFSLCGLVLGADVTGELGTGAIPPIVPTDVYEKSRVAMQHGPAGIVVLGSSTARWFHPDDVDMTFGTHKSVNLAFSGARPSELQGMWDLYVRHGGSASQVLIGYDTLVIASETFTEREVGTADGKLPRLEQVTEQLTYGGLKTAASSWRTSLEGAGTSPAKTYGLRGEAGNWYAGPKILDGHDDTEPLKIHEDSTRNDILEHPNRYGAKSIRSMETFVQALVRQGVEVEIILPPWYPESGENLSALPQWVKAESLVDASLPRICKMGASVHDLRSFVPLSEAPHGFHDASHLKREGASSVMEAIVNGRYDICHLSSGMQSAT